MNEQMTPETIVEMVRGYWHARILLSAMELDLFDHLGDEELSVQEIAGRIGSDARATEILLNALVGLEFLDKREGKFANRSIARQCLVKDAPGSLWGPLMHNAFLWPRWSALTDVVRTGQSDLGERSPKAVESFILAMHRFASQRAATVVDHLDLDGVGRALDLGGGPGTYSCEMARRRDDLRVTLLDLPPVIPIAKRIVEENGLADRVELREGDCLVDDYGDDYDLVFVSAIIHANTPQEIELIFRKVFESLAPGGTLVVQDFFMDADKASPAFGAVFAINMLVATEGGATYSRDETSRWLSEAGFEAIEHRETGLDASLMIGRKPKR